MYNLPQVKQSLISSTVNLIYKLSNDLRLKDLKKLRNIRKISNFDGDIA